MGKRSGRGGGLKQTGTCPRVNTVSSLEVVKREVHLMGDFPEKVKV